MEQKRLFAVPAYIGANLLKELKGVQTGQHGEIPQETLDKLKVQIFLCIIHEFL